MESIDYLHMHAQLLDMLGAKDHVDAAGIIGSLHAHELAQEKAEPVAEGMQPSRPKPHMPAGMLGIEDFCFCNNEVSLQSISGGGSTEGYLGSVRLKVDGEFVTYVRKNTAPPAERVRVPDDVAKLLRDVRAEYIGRERPSGDGCDAETWDRIESMLSAAPEADHG